MGYSSLLVVVYLAVFSGVCRALCRSPHLFTCDDNTCISKARVCDGGNDCRNGEDESVLKAGCDSEIPRCKPRNLISATANGYSCKRSCNPSSRNPCHTGRKRCICDDECGYVCVNPNSRCPRSRIPIIPNAIGYDVIRFNRNERVVANDPPRFKHRDMIKYACRRGMTLVGPLPRCNSFRRWTRQLPICKMTTTPLPSTRGIPVGRIANGQDAVKNAWPWFALIVQNSLTFKQSLLEKNLVGGGSIINKHWVLTAAHVFKNKTRNDFIVFVGLSKRPFRNELVKSNVKGYLIGENIEHPNYNPPGWNNDIALIKLGSRIDKNMSEISDGTNGLTFGPSIRMISLCSKRGNCRAQRGEAVTVIGFGHTKSFGPTERYSFRPPRKLQEARIRIEDVARCRQESPEFTDNMLCCVPLNYGAAQDACPGDSGGPLMKQISDPENRKPIWVQIGIVSFGYGCGTDIPGYYTDVSKYTSWIDEKTAVEKPPIVSVTPSSLSVRDGNEAILRCDVTSSTPVEVRWYRVGRQLQGSAVIGDDGYSLRIPVFSPTDAGTYECVATNQVGTGRDTGVLSAARRRESIEVTVEEPTYRRLLTGSEVTFVCTAASETMAYILYWTKQEGSLPRSRSTEFKGILHIRDLTEEDSGTYVCTGSSMYDVDRETAELVVVRG